MKIEYQGVSAEGLYISQRKLCSALSGSFVQLYTAKALEKTNVEPNSLNVNSSLYATYAAHAARFVSAEGLYVSAEGSYVSAEGSYRKRHPSIDVTNV